jgi:hypothetical protein
MPRRNATKSRAADAELLPLVPLLVTESESDFKAVHDAIRWEVKPCGIIEEMWLADLIYNVWEIARLRRCKAGIINTAFAAALKRLCSDLLRHQGATVPDASERAARLAGAWFTDRAAKREVSRLLDEFQLDETAIEAEAIRHSADDLEALDRLLASLEARRNKALRCIAEYRESLAAKLRKSSERLLDGKALEIADASKSNSAEAA